MFWTATKLGIMCGISSWGKVQKRTVPDPRKTKSTRSKFAEFELLTAGELEHPIGNY